MSCAIGLAVLEVMRTEKLMTSATNVGRFLKDSLTQLAKSHGCVGGTLGGALGHWVGHWAGHWGIGRGIG